MKKLVIALLVAAAICAALAVPAFARNTSAVLYNNGTSTCVNNNASHANSHNQGGVAVYTNSCF
jgi:hypothetical protein